MLAAEKRRSRKNRSGSIGLSTRSSHATNAPSTAADAANDPSTIVDVQPCPGASMIAHTRVVRPITDRTAPMGSRRDTRGSRDSGTSHSPAATALTTNGTLTRNTEPHQKCFRRYPPTTGPNATPSPATPDQIAIALARSRSGNVFVRIDSVEGMIAAAPTPISARLAISSSAEPLNAPRTEPRPKMPRPAKSIRRRPNRSPRLPATSRRPAKTSRYESTIHCSPLADGERSSWSVGNATFRIVLSRLIRNRLRPRTPSAHHLRPYGACDDIPSSFRYETDAYRLQ